MLVALPTQQIPLAGLSPVFVSADAGGDNVEPGDRSWLAVRNADTASHTVSLVTPATLATGDPYPDKQVPIPAADERLIGPLTGLVFRNPTTGRVNITYDAVTGLTVAVLRI